MKFWSKIILIAGSAVISSSASAQRGCNPAEILQNDSVSYQRSTMAWLSFVDLKTSSSDSENASDRGYKYNGMELTAKDAKRLSAYFQEKSDYNLTMDQKTSIVSSYLPPDRLAAYLACLRFDQTNIDLILPQGAEIMKTMQVIVKWHPRYNVDIKDNKNEREIQFLLNNGTVLGDMKHIIEPFHDAVFTIQRQSLDEDFSLVVSIDGRSTPIVQFPPKPKYKIEKNTVKAQSDQLNRNKNAGLSPADLKPVCISPSKGNIFLPSTAHVDRSGGGYEWTTRTGVNLSKNTEDEVCMKVQSFGEACPGSDCNFWVTGYLDVVEVGLVKIKD